MHRTPSRASLPALRFVLAASAVLIGCGRIGYEAASLDGSFASDAGALDAGVDLDGSVPIDAARPDDAGPRDAGPPFDAGPRDAGPLDAGPDAGSADAGSVDGGPSDGGPTDAGPTDGGAGLPTFQDEFGGPLTGWAMVGGRWSTRTGSLAQDDDRAAPAYAWRPDLPSLTNYRIESQMQQISGDPIGALEVSFRIDPAATSRQYFCVYEPNTGRLRLVKDVGGASLAETFLPLATRPAPSAALTMEIVAAGSAFSCRLLEAPASVISAVDGTYAVGSVGVKTQRMAGLFAYFRVYAM